MTNTDREWESTKEGRSDKRSKRSEWRVRKVWQEIEVEGKEGGGTREPKIEVVRKMWQEKTELEVEDTEGVTSEVDIQVVVMKEWLEIEVDGKKSVTRDRKCDKRS